MKVGTYSSSTGPGLLFPALAAVFFGASQFTRRPNVWGTLVAYFAGDIDALDALAVAPQGTEFRQRVWKELREIRAGTTVSYGELAARVGAPGAARAVGTANATNPICLVIPCHRVVRAGGALGGYGFGIERKRWLLAHEERPTGLFEAGDAQISKVRV